MDARTQNILIGMAHSLPPLPWEYVLSGDGLRVFGGNGFKKQHFMTIPHGPHFRELHEFLRIAERELWECTYDGW